MFPAFFYDPFVNQNENNDPFEQASAVRSAQMHYLEAKRKGWWRQKFARLTGRRSRLKELSQLYEHNNIINFHPRGVKSVEINRIIGSENRANDFDDRFLPLNNHNSERWITIAELRLLNVALPAVELIKVNDNYYVRDGHHRISVAKHFGQTQIDANVTEMVIQPSDVKPKASCPAMAMTVCMQPC